MADSGAKALSLRWLLSAITVALTRAASAGDLEAAKLAQAYKEDEFLSTLEIPSFTIGSAQVTIRFMLVGPNPDDPEDVMIRTDPDALGPLAAYRLTELTVALTERLISAPPPK